MKKSFLKICGTYLVVVGSSSFWFACANIPASPGASQGRSSSDSTALTAGQALYADNCQGCHGALPDSDVSDATLAMIQSAIDNNVGGMGEFAALSDQDLQDLETALSTSVVDNSGQPTDGTNTGGTNTGGTNTGTTDTNTIGETLYADNCQRCHGSLANSGVSGVNASEIRSAIDRNRGGMGSLSFLTDQDLQDLEAALGLTNTNTGNTSSGDDSADSNDDNSDDNSSENEFDD